MLSPAYSFFQKSGLVAQGLEHTLDKRGVGGSNPPRPTINGPLAQLGERLICIQEVVGSIPIGSTILRRSFLRKVSMKNESSSVLIHRK